MDEVLVCRPVAGLSYRNPVEIVHVNDGGRVLLMNML